MFSRAAANAAKAAGMAQVAGAASTSWSVQMEAHAVATARAMRYFTSDDVYRRAYAVGLTANTHDQRAFGPVMMRLAKAGVCRKASLPPVNSQRATLHASPRSVWESLIYGQGNTP
jgi:hypothetical protein